MTWKIGKLKIARTTIAQPGEVVDPDRIVVNGILDDNLYNDITSIEEWFNVSEYDYKFVRRRIQELVPEDDISWNNLNPNEKYIVSILKATTLERVREVLGQDMDSHMTNFDLNSQKCRNQRVSRAKAILLNNVERLDAFLILQILEQDKLLDKYVIQGIEGTLDTDPIEGLFNFIESTPLSHYGGQTTDIFGDNLGKYESTGILTRTLSYQTGSQITNNSDLVLEIMNCLREGIY